MLGKTHDMEELPGWEIISQGLLDARAGWITASACAIWIALPRLQRAGLVDDTILANPIREPESVLYRLLGAKDGNAFSRYNAFLRRLVRFEHSLDRLAQTKERMTAGRSPRISHSDTATTAFE